MVYIINQKVLIAASWWRDTFSNKALPMVEGHILKQIFIVAL